MTSQTFRAVIGAMLFTCVFASGTVWADEHCHVAGPHDSTPADKASLSGHLGEAEGFYREAISKSPHDVEMDAGLIRTLLREQKVDEASSTAQAALAAKPDSVPLLIALSEVQLRQGKIPESAATANQAFHSDKCNARIYLLRGRIFRLNSMYATANAQISVAHQLDPFDAEIRGAWVQTLPLEKRIEEQKQYLANAMGVDPGDHSRGEKYLAYLVSEASNAGKNCRLGTPTTSAEMQLIPLMSDDKFTCDRNGYCGQTGKHVQGWGLHVAFNGKDAELEVDSGASGLLISRAVAERAGLKPDEKIQLGGVGDQGSQGGYTAKVNSIKVGSMEFRDCVVEVTDRKEIIGTEGLIGTDVFSSYLVTLDYPMRKFGLAPLPERPGDHSAPTLNTEAASQGSGTSAGSAQSGPHDRYIAPEMKDYTPFFRAGHFIIIPVVLNGKAQRLFMVDSGAFSSSITPEAAAAVTKVRGDSLTSIQGLSGNVKRVGLGDQIVFSFGGIRQTNNNLYTFDSTGMSRFAGIEISGFLGNTILRELATHIDYRDGLIKFDYDERHGNRDFSK